MSMLQYRSLKIYECSSAFLFSTLAVLQLGVTSVQAQAPAAGPQYVVLPIDAKFPDDKARDAAMKAKDGAIQSDRFDENVVKTYYEKVLLPKLTQVEQQDRYDSIRDEIMKDMGKVKAKSQYNAMLFVNLNVLASGKDPSGRDAGPFHPSAVVNAILLMGLMNEQDGVGRSSLPKPYPNAFRILAQLAVDQTKPDFVRAEAIRGLERHVRLTMEGLSPALKSSIADNLLKKMVMEPKPALRDPEVHSYMQRRCLEILVQFDSDKHAEVREFMFKAIANKDEHPLLREFCMSNISRVKLEGSSEQELSATTTGIAHYVLHAAQDWKKRVGDAKQASGGGYSPGGPMVQTNEAVNPFGSESGPGGPAQQGAAAERKPPSPKDAQSPDVRIERRRLIQVLDSATLAMDGKLSSETADAPSANCLLVTLKGKDLETPALSLNKAIIELQKQVNDVKITDKKSLATTTETSLDSLISTAKEFPGVAGIDAPADEEGKKAAQ